MTDIERMAAIAAEHVNGGKFHDGDFYSPEHRQRWIEAMTLATEPLRKEMSETALTALSVDSRAMTLSERLAEAVEVMRSCRATYVENDDASALERIIDRIDTFLAKLEPKP